MFEIDYPFTRTDDAFSAGHIRCFSSIFERIRECFTIQHVCLRGRRSAYAAHTRVRMRGSLFLHIRLFGLAIMVPEDINEEWIHPQSSFLSEAHSRCHLPIALSATRVTKLTAAFKE